MRGLIMAAQQQQRDDVWLYKGVVWDWGEVTNPVTGRIWMDRNLGAAGVSTAPNTEYGDLFQWGRLDDLHQNRTSSLTAVNDLSTTDIPGHPNFILTSGSPNDWRQPQNDNLWQPSTRINLPAPKGWRVPTVAEWQAELATWSSQNRDGAFSSVLVLPRSGYRRESVGDFIGRNNFAYYWSCDVRGIVSDSLYFDTSVAEIRAGTDGRRARGHAVRLIKEL